MAAELAIFYPYRDRSIFSTAVLASLASICLITALAVWQIQKRP